MTGHPVDRAKRSAVRNRAPVSSVPIAGFGSMCTLARTIFRTSLSTMIAPSILASSASIAGVKSASRRSMPPAAIFWTSGPDPITTSAPFPCWMIRSTAVRIPVPGATRDKTSRNSLSSVSHLLRDRSYMEIINAQVTAMRRSTPRPSSEAGSHRRSPSRKMLQRPNTTRPASTDPASAEPIVHGSTSRMAN